MFEQRRRYRLFGGFDDSYFAGFLTFRRDTRDVCLKCPDWVTFRQLGEFRQLGGFSSIGRLRIGFGELVLTRVTWIVYARIYNNF